ncbi:hypothetical protein K488DRAFT_50553 [Vararia minispora EC-137]|uniref:Uncharacterized protein n=1 Tax=Vararia minispora EC-137 TaxID=1314806 RepID=A0ACB8QKP7_9AGAM|nr:hypothetical protein K488DRAFT_50553 [Vararia minispora EC-137]
MARQDRSTTARFPPADDGTGPLHPYADTDGAPNTRSRAATGTPGSPALASEAGRQLNVTDALSYLDAVKVQFQDRPDVYNKFLDIMKDFKSQQIDTPGVIERVSGLFYGNVFLIEGFNTFLPPGYHINASLSAHDPDVITVTTPQGIIRATPFNRQFPAFNNMSLAAPLPPSLPHHHSLSRPVTPSHFVSAPQPALPPPPPLSQQQQQQLHQPPPPPPIHAAYSPGPQNTAAMANVLAGEPSGGANSREFNHAIQYLNKIKTRFPDEPETYKQFLEILQGYRREQQLGGQRDPAGQPMREQKMMQDVFVQVQILFKDADDLLVEFKDFLPTFTAGGMMPVPVSRVGSHASTAPPPPSESGASPQKSATKRRKRETGPKEPGGGGASASTAKAPDQARVRSHRIADKKRPRVSKSAAKQRAASPPFSSATLFPAPSSPQPTPPHHALPPPPPQHTGLPPAAHPPSDELTFFDRVRRALEARETYDDFLRLLALYAQDVLDTRALVTRADALLPPDLGAAFRAMLAWDDSIGNVERGPPGSIRTGPPDSMLPRPDEESMGPSYRRMPESEIHLATSGRNQLGRSVLNDEWMSHPTWQSEVENFVAHKKNAYEEYMHKCEDERHEYQIHLEGLARTIAVLEPIASRIESMAPDERALFRLRPDFGGRCPRIYERTVRKIYGRDMGALVYQELQDSPGVAVPVVLARLKQKNDDWRRAQREWEPTWRQIDARNFYKSLDTAGLNFKANDKKHITAKAFVGEIEALRRERLVQEKEAGQKGGLGYQLVYAFPDPGVLHDTLKLVYAFLDHSAASYAPAERRALERFLRAFVPTLCMAERAPFDAACGPLEGGWDDDGADDAGVDAVLEGIEDEGSEWVRECVGAEGGRLRDAPVAPRPFFCNTTFYTLLRLLQLLYSRLAACKAVGAAHAANGFRALHANPVAVQLGLDEPQGAAATLRAVLETVREGNALYAYLLDACEKLFAGEVEQGAFEEHMRWFFGTKAYLMYTVDKVIAALVKQVQTAVADQKCQELWALLRQQRAAVARTRRDLMRYRRQAERRVGADENLYRVEWDVETRTMRLQLVGPDEASVDGAPLRPAVERWREYVDSYVLDHPTEWVGGGRGMPVRPAPFLRRTLVADESGAARAEGDLGIRISLGTYKLFYEGAAWECVSRVRGADEEALLVERAAAREEDRRRGMARWA